MRTIAATLAVSLMLTVVPPVARANEPRIMVVDGAKQKSPAYLDFFRTFNEALVELFRKGEGQSTAPDHWVILLSPALSPIGETLITIYAIRNGDELGLPILVAVLSERSEATTIRTAAKSARRVIIEIATRQQRETPPAPKTKTNLRTKTRAEVSHF